jgi:hypothetical protein
MSLKLGQFIIQQYSSKLLLGTDSDAVHFAFQLKFQIMPFPFTRILLLKFSGGISIRDSLFLNLDRSHTPRQIMLPFIA